jgi:hypothetical protein
MGDKMQLILEQDEIIELLREALKARGMKVPSPSAIRLRRNNKKGTLRVAFISGEGDSKETSRE